MPSYSKNNFKESNINYLNKDFSQFKQSLISYAQNYFPETYKDFNETSPGMMLMEMSAYVGDVLSFYIDQQYREMLLPLAEEKRNIIQMSKMYGYKVKPTVPAYTDLSFQSVLTAQSADPANVNYSNGGIFEKGIKVTSTTDTNIIFETLDMVDFTISQSNDNNVIYDTNSDGVISSYLLHRNVKAVSGETKIKNHTIESPQKFRKITLDEKNVIDIISVIDSNGNNWYEVDFLAQDRIPIPTHYTNDENRDTAYYDLNGLPYVADVAVPYSLEYIKTIKRFVRETNEDNTTSLVFGNGILKDGTSIDEGFLNLEQAGIIIPGQAGDLDMAIDPLLGDEYSTLGETPNQTTLTISYRVGGGVDSNVTSNDLTTFTSPNSIGSNQTATLLNVSNNIPARGGRDAETVDEIKEKTKAFFTTQNRCVTKSDYEARVMNMQSKFGSIAKVYVGRSTISELLYGEQQQSVFDYLSGVDQLIQLVNTALQGSTPISDINAAMNTFNTDYTRPSESQITEAIELGTITIHILSYDRRKNLIGNPHPQNSNNHDHIPLVLKQNLSNYINNFKILTDEVAIQDGYVINFGVFFNVVAHKFANKQEVKLKCIQKIKDYFNVNKMQFCQPITVSQIEYELMDIDGVRAVNYVTISQNEDYNGDSNDMKFLPSPTFYYSVDSETGEILTDGGNINYGYKYDFQPALVNGIILPPSPQNPGVFELKFPNQNIKGVVK